MFKLYKNKNYNFKQLLFIICIVFIIFIFFNTTVKEGYNYYRRARRLCRSYNNCTSYDRESNTCKLYCGENQECNSGSCLCKSGYHWNGTKCDSCPDGQIWNGNSCVCPSEQHWNGISCIRCVEGQYWDGNACQCPNGKRLKADGTICIDICEKTSDWTGNRCICPEGKTWVVSEKDSESGCK